MTAARPTVGPAVHYHQSGSYDADFEARVSPDGIWTVEGGTYVTRGRTSRQLTRAERRDLARLVAATEGVRAGASPAGGAFATTLRVDARTWHWEGPTAEPALTDLVRWLGTRRALSR